MKKEKNNLEKSLVKKKFSTLPSFPENLGKRKKSSIIKTMLATILLIALVHTVIQFIIPQISSSENLPGISGQVTGVSWFSDTYSKISPTSRILILVQWLAVLILAGFYLGKGILNLKKETKNIPSKSEIKVKKIKPETDLDLVYKLFQKEKILRLEIISKTFGVTDKVSMEWCKILESGKLIKISYPLVGDPKIELIQKDGEKEKKK
ncbi:hypothetical protein CXT76_01270 [Candidatus Parvarchaeota archaeon]|nr:MAG: hypothetical protein CXT76_01270 [Candidatus Parvarchaeota archaeon]HIG52005.1 hypothetical protein [Candidatus Pacearchaeota archaeon]